MPNQPISLPSAGKLLGSRAQVVDVDVPEVDQLGPALSEEPEPVEVGLQLLAEVVVGVEADHAQRRLDVVEVLAMRGQ